VLSPSEWRALQEYRGFADADTVRTANLKAKASQPETKVVDGKEVPDPEVFAARRELHRAQTETNTSGSYDPTLRTTDVESVVEGEPFKHNEKMRADVLNPNNELWAAIDDPATPKEVKDALMAERASILDDTKAAETIADCKGK
jgi:hypothetical protein